MLFAVVVAVIAFAVVAVPWHHAMLIRHGSPFWDELFGDNHWRRMVIGRHGDRGTFEYFLRELGYGMWPWVVLAPAALGWAVLRRPGLSTTAAATPTDIAAASRKQQVIWLGAIWFVSSYALVSLSMTKFHHYVLPAIPGLAIVVGCFLDELIARKAWRTGAAAVVMGLPLLLLITLDLTASKNAAERFLWLFSYDYVQSPTGRPWPPSLDFSTALIVFAVIFAVGSALLVWPRAQRVALWLLPASAVAFTFYVLDDFMPKVAPFWSQKGPIATYYERRRSPDERLVRLHALLAWRDLLHLERDLRRARRGAHRVRSGGGGRSPEGVGGAPSRPARVLHLRAPSAAPDQSGPPPRSAAVVPDRRRDQQQVQPGPSGSLTSGSRRCRRARRYDGRGSWRGGASSRRRGRGARCSTPSSTAASFSPSCCWPTSGGWARWPTDHYLRRPKPADVIAEEVRTATEGVRDFADLQRRLRLVRRAEILRLGVRELGWGTTEEVARELSAFADVCLDVAVAFCDAALTRELGPARADSGAPASFVVMAMGKLGGRS